MDLITKVNKQKAQEDKNHAALSAAVAIVQMDPHAREDLICYLHAFNAAQAARDEDEQEYLLNAIQEVLGTETTTDAPELSEWEADGAARASGEKAKRRLDQETGAFFASYNRLKAQSGLKTIRAVAEAAGLSPTTVNAIEQQRVKPQFKTIQTLAKAFGVDAAELMG